MSSTINAPFIASDAIDDNILTLDGTALAGSTVTIFSGTTDIGTATVNAEGDWTFTTGTLADGSYSLTATDSISGSTSAASPVLNVVVDSPAAPVIDSSALNSTFEEVLTGTATANTTVAVFEGTTELGTAAVSSNGTWNFTTGTLASGDYSFTAADVDSAANMSVASSAVAETVNTTPITNSYFGLTIESYDYNYSYLGGPVEAFPSIPVGVVRSWDVWSPNDGQIEYMDWSSLNPAAGVYDWSALNTWIAANQANNAAMVYTFGDPPAWAGGTTTNLADFQAFVTAIVTQANGAIKYWEGFNEFDVSGIAPALMVQLQEIIYNTVHTLDPGALVLSPTVSGAWSDSTFGQFLADGGGKYFDIAAFHGYNNSTGEGIVPVVQDFQAVLAQYGLSNVPIWDTEWGMESPTAITDPTAQAAYVSTGLILQAATGVQTEIFYAYDNANSALYNTATGQLTAAGVAYEETAQWLDGATEPSGYQVNGSTYTVQLIKNGQSDLLVWNASGQSSYATGAYTQYVDTQGVIHTITGGTVTIGTVPILLETPVTSAPPPAPQITSFSPNSGTVGDAITNATTLTLTGTGEANSTVTVFDGPIQLGTAAVNASGAWSFVTGTLANGAQVFTATDTDAGSLSAASTAFSVTVDTTPPTVSSVAVSGSGIANGAGDLDAGKVVTLTVALSEAVTVANGTPTLTLDDGATATYSGGSGSNALTFSYTVAAGQNTADLAVTAVNLNSASVTDGAGNVANLSGAVTSPAGTLQIDTTAPTVSSLVASGTGISSGTGDLDAGKTVTLTVNLSEAVAVAGGSPTLTLNDGGTATYSGGSGSNALTFSYTVAAGQNTADLAVTAVNLNSASVTDGAGNVANLSGAVTSPAGTLQIDTTVPAAPVIGTDTVNANSTVSLSGTAEANSTVTVYDGQTALGTTAASSTGAWNYTTGTLPNGAQTFTATATDAAGNTSAASNAVDPNIGASTEFTGVQAGTLPVANGTTLDITGTVDNTGTVSLNAAGNTADLAVVGAATLTGAGKVTLSNNAGNVISSNGAAATLTNVNNTISGAGAIGDSHLTLNNQGTINANDTLALVINTGSNTITNSGTLEATSSGGLDIDSNVNNSKTIEALGTNAKIVIESTITNTTTGLVLASGSDAQVDLDNATISGGKLQTSGSNAMIETFSGSTDAFDGGTVSSGSTVEINDNSTLILNDSVSNSGTLLANGGTLDADGTLAGGTTEISGAGRVVIAQSSSENVSFLSKSTGQLVLNQATSYTGTISGFGITQSIDLTDINFAAGVKISYASNSRKNTSGVLTITEGTQTVRLELTGTYTLANFKVASDGVGGTLLTDPTVTSQAPGNASETIGNNTVVEVNTSDKGNVTFSGTNGTLWLDQPATFTGKVSGFGAQNVIDLPGIAFEAQTTLGYSPNGNNTGGTLSLTEGANSAKIALLGSYMASSFVMESDNHGGTMILADAVQSASQTVLTNPHHG